MKKEIEVNLEQKPVLALTMGDPAGVGPEVCVKALADKNHYDICRPFVVGDKDVLEHALSMCPVTLKVQEITDPRKASYANGTINVFNLANLAPEQFKPGVVTADQGRAAFEYVDKAISLALDGRVDANVTGPINKEAVNKAGFHFAGHTEIYATRCKSKDYAMMLADDGFRVIHVSTHVPLREACDRVKKDRVLRVIQLAHGAISRLVDHEPVIGVAGLNPHCGEARMFGTEDEDEILPAVKAAQDAGINVQGPIPADTIFSKMKGGSYDGVVVMYHDQGHIPTKLQGFQMNNETGEWENLSGVNVTLGLPIIRVSVDHGTAFDIADRGVANPQSMSDAIRMAALLAGKK